MLFSLRGKLIFTDINSAVVECGGVGYRCFVTGKTMARLPQIGEETILYTYMAVRDDAVDLFGFIDLEELDFFKLIISVNGVGPKIGISALTDFTPSQFAACIAAGDAKTISKANGIGAKTAQRIVLELKDKVGNISDGAQAVSVGDISVSGNSAQAVEALVSLGFTQTEAMRALSSLDSSLPVEQLVKLALKSISV